MRRTHLGVWTETCWSILAMAEFAPNSATVGVWPTNGGSLSRNNILCNRLFHEVIEIIDEVAAQNTLEGHAGLE